MTNPFLDNNFEIQWSQLRPDILEDGIVSAVDIAQARIDDIANQDLSSASFESTFNALENATEIVENAWKKATHLDSLCNTPELRKAFNNMLPKISVFFSSIPLNEKLWKIIKHSSQSDEVSRLGPVQKRFIDETINYFTLHGADLSEDDKKRFSEIEKELTQITQTFSENVLDASNEFEIIVTDKEKLSGLPQSAVDAAQQDALNKGFGSEDSPQWRFSLQAPSYVPAIKYLDDADLRKRLWEAYNLVGRNEPYNNKELVWKILSLRNEKAKLLQKNNFADLILGRRMAKNGDTAKKFIEEFHQKIKAAYDRECDELENFKAEKSNQPKEALEPWETAYWAEKLRKEKYDFDTEELRPYFPIKNVIDGLVEITELIYDIRVKERPSIFLKANREGGPPSFPGTLPPWARPVEGWHKNIKYYEIRDYDKTHLGSFYADWYPRESKRNGAWMEALITGGPDGKKRNPHLGVICGNLSPAINNNPSLLTHDEVLTIFHEFGHLIHHIFGEIEIKSLNGTNVAWDFVELPSQIMENWCWEKEGLDLIAKHFESGERISDNLFEKMLRSRNFHSARNTMRQLSFAKMDLELHCNFENFSSENFEEKLEELLSDYYYPTKTKQPLNLFQFSHLFADSTGYAAGYYSYKWAEVLDADVFTRFRNEGVLNGYVGKEFREKILSKGNSEDPEKLFRDFMQRNPDINSLLKREGLLEN